MRVFFHINLTQSLTKAFIVVILAGLLAKGGWEMNKHIAKFQYSLVEGRK